MNVARFFEHWRIAENPFRGEEARHDPVFRRLASRVSSNGRVTQPGRSGGSAHSDFEKIAGDFGQPSTSIVFGEKGSGKTAIRLQLADDLERFNRQHPEHRVFLIAYDDLNPVVDRFHERQGGDDPGKSLEKFRLVDHIDVVLQLTVPRVVDAVLEERFDSAPVDLGGEWKRRLKQASLTARQDLAVLQGVYDRPEQADRRAQQLRRVLKLPRRVSSALWTALAWLGWALPAGVLGGYLLGGGSFEQLPMWFQAAFVVALLAWVAGLFKKFVWDRLRLGRVARRVRKQLRVSPRSESSLRQALAELDPGLIDPAILPMTATDEQRYGMLDRLRRVLGVFGYTGMMIIVDRVDEPTLVRGDPERMRALVWPLLNHKFLQQEGLGLKLLLPIELRHALYRESAAFFQEARLDKQSLVERLSWSGPMLHDMCNMRLRACMEDGAEPVTLQDLFAEDVTRDDLLDALEQMQQPRDAFKMLYQCITVHCANVTEDQEAWRVPKHVLEMVRREQAERVRQLQRGIAPA